MNAIHGQKVTIAHNCSKAVELYIGSSPVTIQSNLKNSFLSNVVKVKLNPRRKLSIHLFKG